MKRYRKLLLGALVITILVFTVIGMRPTLSVSLNGSSLQDCDVIVVGGGESTVLHLDRDGEASLGYSYIGKQVVVAPNPSITVEGVLDGAVTKVSAGKNVVILTDDSKE